MKESLQQKKRLCFLSNGLVWGGTDTFAVNLIKGLDKDKYDVTVALSIDIEDDNLSLREQEILTAGAKTVRTSSINKGFGKKLKHFVRLYKLLKKGKFDIFHTNVDLFNGPNLFVAWLAGVKVRVCHSHNAQQERSAGKKKGFIISVYQFIMRKLCWRFSNRRCGCSEQALDFLFKDKWKKDQRATVINNGIDINLYHQQINKAEKLSELGLLPNVKYILTVGRLSRQKNPMMIVDVIYELSKFRSDCELLWVGVGEMQDQISSKVYDYGISDKVHLLGRRDDVNHLMQISDAFLFPSIFEGLGIVLVEAQAANLPCLVSDIVPPEVDCGGCKFISLNSSSELWAKQLSEIINDKDILKVNQQKLNEFSIENMVRQVDKMYE